VYFVNFLDINSSHLAVDQMTNVKYSNKGSYDVLSNTIKIALYT